MVTPSKTALTPEEVVSLSLLIRNGEITKSCTRGQVWEALKRHGLYSITADEAMVSFPLYETVFAQ